MRYHCHLSDIVETTNANPMPEIRDALAHYDRTMGFPATDSDLTFRHLWERFTGASVQRYHAPDFAKERRQFASFIRLEAVAEKTAQEEWKAYCALDDARAKAGLPRLDTSWRHCGW